VDGACSTCGGEERWENLRESDYLEDPDADGRIILSWIFRKWDVRTWTGSICLSIGTDGGHL